MMRACSFGRSLCVGLILAGLSLGCGSQDDKWKSQRPAVAPASGTVTYKGAAVEGATVTLVPQEKGTGAADKGTGGAGITDAEGAFTLRAFQDDDGVVPGSYRVMIVKREQAPPGVGPEGGHDEGDTPPPKDLLPAKYADPDASGLTVEIPPEGKEDLKFDLTD